MEYANISDFLYLVSLNFPTLVIIFSVWSITRCKVAYNVGYQIVEYLDFNSYNPLNHIDPVGIFAFSCLLSVRSYGGYTFALIWLIMMFLGIQLVHRPPFDRHYLLDGEPRWKGLAVTLSGTIGLFFLSYILQYFVIYLSLWYPHSSSILVIVGFFRNIIIWAISIGLLHLVPLPPFEGAMLLPLIFGEAGEDLLEMIEPYSIIILLCLFFLPPISTLFWVGLNKMLQLVFAAQVYLVWF